MTRQLVTNPDLLNPIPVGGTTGQVLAKSSGADYAVGWVNQTGGGGGLTLPLTQNLTFSPDETWNIGSGPSSGRPYQIFVGSTIWIGDGTNVMQIITDTIGAPYSLAIRSGGGYDLQLIPAAPGRVIWSQNLAPGANNLYDIGSASYRVRDLYVGGVVDGTLIRPAATDTLEVRNGLNAETLRVSSGYTDASNYERLAFNTSTFDSILTEQAGTGSARTLIVGTTGAQPLIFQTGGNNRWRVDATGNLTADVDNAVDIGASGATRPRALYVGTRVMTPEINTTTTAIVIGPTTGSSTLTFRTSNVNQWWLNTGGHFLAITTNTLDIGQSASGKPRNVFVAGALATGIKAGAPVDADVNTPTDGMLRVDTTANALAYRSGGLWRSAASTPTNLLTNGGFEVWQRGNGPFSTSPLFGPDRWQVSTNGTDVVSVSRDGTANRDNASLACAACTVTKGTGTNAALQQPLDAGDTPQVRGRTVTLTMRVRTSTASAVQIAVYDTAYHLSAFHTGGGAYETLSITWATSASAAQIYVAAVFSASCTAYLDNAMLVLGSQPADYIPLTPADDMARCLRYYERLAPLGTNFPFIDFYNNAGAVDPVLRMPFWFKAVKAVTPTITLSTTGWGLTNCPARYTEHATLIGFTLRLAASANGEVQFYNDGSTNPVLTAEANP